jgi:hypothetical protein
MKNACAGVGIGFLLFFSSWGLLFWNEGRAVKRQQDLDEGRDILVQVGLTQANGVINKALDSGLVYVTGTLDGGNSSIFDDVFKMNVPSALKYEREVEMYLWQERSETRTEKKSGGGTTQVKTYYYDQDWSPSLLVSSSFKESAQHVNPTSFLINPYSATSTSISLGAYGVSDRFLGEVDWWTTWFDAPVNASDVKFSNFTSSYSSGQFQLRKNSASNTVGDTRVNFRLVLPDDVSVVAMQNSDGILVPYITEGDRELFLFSRGVRSSDELFKEAEDDNTNFTWVLRFVGFIVMVVGICLILNPIATAFDALPFCGDALEGCIGGCIIPCIAICISIPMSLMIISIAWIFYRPVFAVVTLLLLLILGYIGFKYIKPKLSKPPPEGKPNQQYGQSSATAVPMGNQQVYGEQEIAVGHAGKNDFVSPSQPPPQNAGVPAPFSMALDNPPPSNNYGGGYASAPQEPVSQTYGSSGTGVYKPPS